MSSELPLNEDLLKIVDEMRGSMFQKPGLLVLKVSVQLEPAQYRQIRDHIARLLSPLEPRILILDPRMDLTVYSDEDLAALGLKRA